MTSAGPTKSTVPHALISTSAYATTASAAAPRKRDTAVVATALGTEAKWPVSVANQLNPLLTPSFNHTAVDRPRQLTAAMCEDLKQLVPIDYAHHRSFESGNVQGGYFHDSTVEWQCKFLSYTGLATFALKSDPNFVFGSPSPRPRCRFDEPFAPDNQDVRKRFKNLQVAQEVIKTEKLDLLILPHTEIVKCGVEAEDYLFLAQHRLIDRHPKEEAYLYAQHADQIDDAVAQMATLVAKTGYNYLGAEQGKLLFDEASGTIKMVLTGTSFYSDDGDRDSVGYILTNLLLSTFPSTFSAIEETAATAGASLGYYSTRLGRGAACQNPQQLRRDELRKDEDYIAFAQEHHLSAANNPSLPPLTPEAVGLADAEWKGVRLSEVLDDVVANINRNFAQNREELPEHLVKELRATHLKVIGADANIKSWHAVAPVSLSYEYNILQHHAEKPDYHRTSSWVGIILDAMQKQGYLFDVVGPSWTGYQIQG